MGTDCPVYRLDVRHQLLSQITDVETLAIGSAIRDILYLRRRYGSGRWRKLKGIATVSTGDGTICRAEIHWYEANGIGRVDLKIKRYVD